MHDVERSLLPRDWNLEFSRGHLRHGAGKSGSVDAMKTPRLENEALEEGNNRVCYRFFLIFFLWI